jgi:hypothetical protein
MRLRKMSDEIAFMKSMADGHDPKIMATYWDISDVRMCDGSQSLTDADCEIILEKFCDMNCIDYVFESVNESLQQFVDDFKPTLTIDEYKKTKTKKKLSKKKATKKKVTKKKGTK